MSIPYFKSHRKIVIFLIVLLEFFLLLCIGFLIIHTRFTRDVRNLARTIIRLPKSEYQNPIPNELRYYFEPKPGIEKSNYSWLPEPATYAINSDGLHDRFDYEVHKPIDVLRIVALGDSFTFGWGVDTHKNWTEQLEDLLNKKIPCANYTKVEVINLGVSGYDLEYEKMRYYRKGSKYSPDLVIWMLLGNDFYEIREVMEESFTTEMRKHPINAEKQPKEWGDTYERIAAEFAETHSPEWMYAYHKAILDNFFTLYNGPVYFVGLSAFSQAGAELRKILEGRKNVWVDTSLKEIYDKPGMRLADDHPTAEAHMEFAQSMADFIHLHNLFKCANDENIR